MTWLQLHLILSYPEGRSLKEWICYRIYDLYKTPFILNSVNKERARKFASAIIYIYICMYVYKRENLIRIKIEFLLESNFMSCVSSKHLIFVSS